MRRRAVLQPAARWARSACPVACRPPHVLGSRAQATACACAAPRPGACQWWCPTTHGRHAASPLRVAAHARPGVCPGPHPLFPRARGRARDMQSEANSRGLECGVSCRGSSGQAAHGAHTWGPGGGASAPPRWPKRCAGPARRASASAWFRHIPRAVGRPTLVQFVYRVQTRHSTARTPRSQAIHRTSCGSRSLCLLSGCHQRIIAVVEHNAAQMRPAGSGWRSGRRCPPLTGPGPRGSAMTAACR